MRRRSQQKVLHKGGRFGIEHIDQHQIGHTPDDGGQIEQRHAGPDYFSLEKPQRHIELYYPKQQACNNESHMDRTALGGIIGGGARFLVVHIIQELEY